MIIELYETLRSIECDVIVLDQKCIQFPNYFSNNNIHSAISMVVYCYAVELSDCRFDFNSA